MLITKYTLLLSVYIFLQYCAVTTLQSESEDSDADRESDYAIYRRCNHRSTFSEQELQIALQYFINKSKNALIKPKRAPCQRLKVRREFRCLSHQERLVLVNALKQLYNNDTLINRMTEVHSRYWPAWHKSVEASAAHSQIINIIENALDSIVPGLTIPYWDGNIESIAPERSLVWDYFGRAGDKRNGYCIRGGQFDDVLLTREQRCIRREWNPDGTVPPWQPPEYYAHLYQSTNFSYVLSALYNIHFKTHLFTGGYNGDLSVKIAPYDPFFYPSHIQQTQLFFQYSLQGDPTEAVIQFGAFGHYDFNVGAFRSMDLEIDRLSYFSDKYVIEFYHLGYGEQCSLTDREIEWALTESSNTRRPLPRAVQRLRESLSPQRFAELFPRFAAGDYNAYQNDLFEVGDRNRGPNCRKIPRVQNFSENANNRRQLEAFIWDVGFDVSPFVLEREEDSNAFIDELNRSGYCSPYA